MVCEEIDRGWGDDGGREVRRAVRLEAQEEVCGVPWVADCPECAARAASGRGRYGLVSMVYRIFDLGGGEHLLSRASREGGYLVLLPRESLESAVETAEDVFGLSPESWRRVEER